MQSSMQYTIGTALSRAQEQGHRVDVLVEGEWLSGVVAALDGMGVVLEDSAGQHCIVRIERVAAVRVRSEAEQRHPAPEEDRSPDGAMPMPGPRHSEATVLAADFG